MKKGSGSKSTIIIGPSKSVLVYALHSLEYVLGLARFRVFVPKKKSCQQVKEDNLPPHWRFYVNYADIKETSRFGLY